MTVELTWNNNDNLYYADLGQKRTIFVDGDEFIEAVHDRKSAYIQERFPGVLVENIPETTVEGIYDEARKELLDPMEWENVAFELKNGQSIHKVPSFYSSWITTEQ